jgi:hypothetical protein
MSLQSDLKLRPDSALDAKWSDLDLQRLFQSDGLCALWNELVRTGELTSVKHSPKGRASFSLRILYTLTFLINNAQWDVNAGIFCSKQKIIKDIFYSRVCFAECLGHALLH